jgi:hypothetical protein
MSDKNKNTAKVSHDDSHHVSVLLPSLNSCIDKMDELASPYVEWEKDDLGDNTNEEKETGFCISETNLERFIRYCQGNFLEVDMNEKMYVLQHKSGQYFKEQNLYLGSAITTSDIDSAAQMTLKKAESKYGCMNEKDDWKIFRVVVGLRLGHESIRHIKAARKADLEKELAALEKELG